MSDYQYFPVPLAHLTSPVALPIAAEEVPWGPSEGQPQAEPFGMLDVADPPESYGEDEVTVLARDPFTLFAHWEANADTLARAGTGSDGVLVLRLHVAAGAYAAPAQIIDERLGRTAGRGYLPAPYPGALIDASIGVRGADGGFTPIAAAPRLRVPYAGPEDGEVEWMEVPPARTRGLRFEPPVPTRHGPASEIPGASQRALPAVPVAPVTGSSAAAVTSPAAPTGPTSPAPGLPTSPTRGSGGLR